MFENLKKIADFNGGPFGTLAWFLGACIAAVVIQISYYFDFPLPFDRTCGPPTGWHLAYSILGFIAAFHILQSRWRRLISLVVICIPFLYLAPIWYLDKRFQCMSMETARALGLEDPTSISNSDIVNYYWSAFFGWLHPNLTSFLPDSAIEDTYVPFILLVFLNLFGVALFLFLGFLVFYPLWRFLRRPKAPDDQDNP